MAHYTLFIAQWATLTPGTTAAKLAQINAQTVAQAPSPNAYLTGAEIYNALVPAEFTALVAAQQQIIRDIVGLGGNIDVNTGTNARTAILNAFGAGTTTRTNLAALVATKIVVPAKPWWQVNGYSGPFNAHDATAAGVS